MSNYVVKSTRVVLHRSNNAQLKKLQHNGVHKPVRTLAYGIRVGRRKR